MPGPFLVLIIYVYIKKKRLGHLLRPATFLESEEFEYVAAAERILAERVLAILVLPAAVLVLSASVLILRVLAVLILLRG